MMHRASKKSSGEAEVTAASSSFSSPFPPTLPSTPAFLPNPITSPPSATTTLPPTPTTHHFLVAPPCGVFEEDRVSRVCRHSWRGTMMTKRRRRKEGDEEEVEEMGVNSNRRNTSIGLIRRHQPHPHHPHHRPQQQQHQQQHLRPLPRHRPLQPQQQQLHRQHLSLRLHRFNSNKLGGFFLLAFISTLLALQGASSQRLSNSVEYPAPDYDPRYDAGRPNAPGAYPLPGSGGQPSPCQESSCYPATGDLLIGRQEKLTATSTCGLGDPSRYCIVSHLEDEKKCFMCDSRQPFQMSNNEDSHQVENVVSTFNNRRKSWWQSVNGAEEVSLRLDLEAEFHFTHLIMTFKTFRPAAFFIERSYDYGQTWKIYRYFAYNCYDDFPGVPTRSQRSIGEVVCESRYSEVAPSTDGEVIFRVLSPNLEIDDPYSENVQELLRVTNLRINFTKLHTLGDDLLDARAEIDEKYYYAVYDMVVRGSCSCYGHASRCIPLDDQQDIRRDMVYGKCDCQHNTKGLNCDHCEDFYNDLPWRPAIGSLTHACQRCECNGHATRCHFDMAVYIASGNTSGGVCDDCAHNTMGRNCQECRPGFFQDPQRDIRDPNTCQPCDCDPVGSENNGECESRTDPANNLVAGRCICRRNVDGRRCDRCKAGFWNRNVQNPEGCERCGCNTLGTLNNRGCDEITGECTCKKYVVGRSCDQCQTEFYGLSDSEEGCKACECDPGGSYDNSCDPINGQCRCRPHMNGRACKRPESGFYCVLLDHYKYEAEYARGEGQTKVIVRAPHPGRPTTWTGEGFMEVHEGDKLDFEISNLGQSMEYEIVVRYEPQLPERWDDVRIKITRPGPVDQSGPCANVVPQDDVKAASLPPGKGEPGCYCGNRYYLVPGPVCLEKGVRYTITFEFPSYRSGQVTPEAQLLIDSIVLVPTVESLPIFQGRGIAQQLKNEYLRFKCRENAFGVIKQTLKPPCRKFVCSISALLLQQGQECKCNPTGSMSTVCNEYGGQCQCKVNVIGRTCDRCAPGYFGFGPQGCQACNCESTGSRSNFCDEVTGQCPCVARAYGRRCDECQPGYYGFPQCQPCRCNGHAVNCDSRTGVCDNCQDSTGGANCERCVDGYYGDPRLGMGIPCRACMCPGGATTSQQFADTCQLISDPRDPRSQDVMCNCRPGYAGARCDQCDDNYFGNPLAPGGSCRTCECNNNINLNQPGSCDVNTGQCTKCQYNTVGFNCEQCRPGYWGEARRQDCRGCDCNLLGTVQSELQNCDRQTGQCRCLPNVVGRQCDRCASNHWKIASGTGCEACNCDPTGSMQPQCNEFTGQCRCHPKRGGRTCGDCEDYHWGDPRAECKPCNCDSRGSRSQQCDRGTGQCDCEVGVAGYRCDRCDRGTTGQLPNCQPCGECFDNWDKIIQGLKNETRVLSRMAQELATNGATGSYERELSDLEEKLRKIREVLDQSQVSEQDVVDLKRQLADIKTQLKEEEEKIKGLSKDLKDIKRDADSTDRKLRGMDSSINDAQRRADDLVRDLDSVQERDLESAFRIIQESKAKSDKAKQQVETVPNVIAKSESIRRDVENLLARESDAFERRYQENIDSLNTVQGLTEDSESKLSEISRLTCGGREGQACDASCGGIGCDDVECGAGRSCNGSLRFAKDAIDFAEKAESELNRKEAEARETLTKVRQANEEAMNANDAAQRAFNVTKMAKDEAVGARTALDELIEKIKEFMGGENATPADIRKIVEDTLAITINQNPAEIDELAKQIKETIQSLTEIDTILAQTKGDLTMAEQLKKRADEARRAANDILSKATGIVSKLEDASQKQLEAERAINATDDKMTEVHSNMAQITTETGIAAKKTTESIDKLNDMEFRVNGLQGKMVEYETKANKAEAAANEANESAMDAALKADEVKDKFDEVKRELDAKYAGSGGGGSPTINAGTLKERAENLYKSTKDKLQRLKELEEIFNNNDIKLMDLQDKIELLNQRMMDALYTPVTGIQPRANFYRTCQP